MKCCMGASCGCCHNRVPGFTETPEGLVIQCKVKEGNQNVYANDCDNFKCTVKGCFANDLCVGCRGA